MRVCSVVVVCVLCYICWLLPAKKTGIALNCSGGSSGNDSSYSSSNRRDSCITNKYDSILVTIESDY